MSIDWFLVVSALVFCIGAGGVLTRRNPLVVLLCLELMLNAANIALIAFARMWGNIDGQIFAIIVMVVAACEVCIGLGLSSRSTAAGCRSTSTSCGSSRASPMETTAWLILAVPAARACIVIGLGFRVWPARVVGAIGTLAIAAAFVVALITTLSASRTAARSSARSSSPRGTTP